jgi:lactoylglutathione lyase
MERTMSFTYDHLHLRTPDVAGAFKFYTTNLDAEAVEPNRPDGSAVINVGGTKILISQLQEGQSIDAHAIGGRSLDHFAFTVPNLEECAKRLKSNGVVFFAEPKEIRPGVKIAFIVAPDNVKIELIQRG